MKLWWMIGLVALVAATACGGDGGDSGDDNGDVTPGATVGFEDLDANLLTAIALQPEDVPAGASQNSLFDQNVLGGDHNVWYSTTYDDNGVQISSTVGWHPDPADHQRVVERLRVVQTGLIKVERNLAIDGADQAFVYGTGETSSAVLIVKDQFFVQVIVQGDISRSAEASDEARTEGYARTVFDRLLQLIDNPDSITPVPGTPRLDPTPAASS